MPKLKNICFLTTLVINALISTWSSAQTAPNDDNTPAGIGRFSGKNVLVVYLSRTGNTRAIAQMIQKLAGGKLVALKSFLKKYDLSRKTIIPFNTNAGYGVGSGFQTVKELCPKSRVLDGFSIQGGIERDGVLFVMKGKKEEEAEAKVRKWLNGLFID